MTRAQVAANGKTNVIIPVHSKVETADVREKVDILISEVGNAGVACANRVASRWERYSSTSG